MWWSGWLLLNDAIRQGADVFVTADYKYHEFFDAENKIIICDIGHYESEVYTKELIISYLSEKFSNFCDSQKSGKYESCTVFLNRR
jgi:putative NIF3 family GTP cyclohydrolase 1 type 2